MNVIDKTYFEREPFFIANNGTINVRGQSNAPVSVDLEDYIKKHERLLLISAMGITLYDQLTAAMALLPFTQDTEPPSLGTAAQKWQDLVLGINYTKDGVEYRYDGLRGFTKDQSLIAAFVYCMHQLENQTVSTATGQANLLAANAESVTSTRKFVDAWQFFMERYQGTDNEIPNVVFNGFGSMGLDYQNNQNQVRSLYQYMQDMNDDDPANFPDLTFRFYSLEESYNSFGI